jgi:hypothetical protein
MQIPIIHANRGMFEVCIILEGMAAKDKACSWWAESGVLAWRRSKDDGCQAHAPLVGTALTERPERLGEINHF